MRRRALFLTRVRKNISAPRRRGRAGHPSGSRETRELYEKSTNGSRRSLIFSRRGLRDFFVRRGPDLRKGGKYGRRKKLSDRRARGAAAARGSRRGGGSLRRARRGARPRVGLARRYAEDTRLAPALRRGFDRTFVARRRRAHRREPAAAARAARHDGRRGCRACCSA